MIRGRRWWRGAALVVVAAIMLAGCGFLKGAKPTRSALQAAGYSKVGVSIETGTGWPSGGGVVVTYHGGPTGDAQQDALNAAHIVWETLRYRFGALEVVTESGGCIASFCANSSDEQGGETYAALEQRFGPRPAGLDNTSAAHAVDHGLEVGGIIAGVVILVVAIGVVILIVMLVRRHNRRRRQGPWGGGGPPFGPGPPNWGAPGPPPQQGWYPPPGGNPPPGGPGWAPPPGGQSWGQPPR